MKRSASMLAALLLTACAAAPVAEVSAPAAAPPEDPAASAEPTPAPAPAPAPVAAEVTTPAAPAARTPTPEPAPEPGVEVVRIRRSELHAQMTSRVGKRITIKSLLVTSSTPIEPGTPALLMKKVPDGEGEDGGFWAPLADVTVASIDKKANLVLTLVSEHEPIQKKPSPWARGLAVLLRVDRAAPAE